MHKDNQHRDDHQEQRCEFDGPSPANLLLDTQLNIQ
jgi:hypothetical protein